MLECPLESWFTQQGWSPHDFQRDAWDAFASGEEVLIQAPTGSGKTYAGLGAVLREGAERKRLGERVTGLQLIWIAPIRALTKEIQYSAQRMVDGMGLDWEVGVRTGDTSSKEKANQRKKMPHILITTPESLHVMLAMKGVEKRFGDLRVMVVDEWHDLMGTKRGTQVELASAWFRHVAPNYRCWGISATVGNLDEALRVLIGPERPGRLVRCDWTKRTEVRSLMPNQFERLPWAGHIGVKLAEHVVDVIRDHESTLIFTNTRAESEIWYHKLLEVAPDLAGVLALHHSSIAKDLRDWVEDALHEGHLKAVVCELFGPRRGLRAGGGHCSSGRSEGCGALHAAGRAFRHQPGATSRIFFLPTHGLELIEASALRDAMAAQRIEPREPLVRSFDVMIQFMCTLAVGDGFRPDDLKHALVGTHAFESVDEEEWRWCLSFIRDGGKALSAYGDYRRVEWDEPEGRYTLRDGRLARRHRMSIGTIVSDQMIKVRWTKGGFLGHVEEYFISSMDPGDAFWFAGMSLEFVRLKEGAVHVRKSKKPKGRVPVYLGGRLSLSSELGDAIRDELDAFSKGHVRSPEMSRVSPLLELQQEMSCLPNREEILIEQFQSEDGHHICVFPFEGKAVHEAIGMLIAHRWCAERPLSMSIASNDYGFELLSDSPLDATEINSLDLLRTEGLMDDLQSGVNSVEMAKRRFRDIAVISGLAFQGFPGQRQGVRHLQSHSGLLFDVFQDFDPENLLFRQAYDELLDQQMEWTRLRRVLERMRQKRVVLERTDHPTPFSFPLVVNRLREKMSSEQLEDRIEKMLVRSTR